ncbi:MAG: DUF3604 domain-containing protein [Parachlamydiaceae bacterium]
MRRSICYCEPSSALAGEARTWKFIYTPSVTLPKGTRLKFDLQSKGREIDWEIPSVNLKKGDPVIYLRLSHGKILPATEIESSESVVPQFGFTLQAPLEAGEQIEIILGAKEGENPKKGDGIKAQTTAQRRRPFLLYIDPSGKGIYDDPDVFNIDIRGAELFNIRILTPSFVAKNKRFDAVVRFEDEYGNLTNNAPDNTLIELSHEHLRENLNWKLFVPETGFISLPNLYFNEVGVYTIQLLNTATGQTFRSSPIRCYPDGNHHLFWGILHGESERYDSTENIESCLRHFRDDKAFNFCGVSPFESQEETSNDTWKIITQNIIDFDEDERFTTFLGFQWNGDNKAEGLRHIIYAKENKPILRQKDLKNSALKKIYKSFSPKELISIPCFTMAKGSEYNFDNFDPDFERVVEIYNAWGSSETTKKEGNPLPIHSTTGIQESAEGSIQKALQRNCRFGFVAGGLDDRGIYADLYESDQAQYSPGLTAIIAAHHTREALIEALYQRSCFATTGERMIVGLYLAGIAMGKEISTADKPGLVINRHLSGYVAGTAKLKKVEIVRNGKVIKTFEPDHYSVEFTYDDMILLEKVAFPSKDKRPPFVYYYLRATQEDGHMAWSSPIWVDYIPLSALPKIKKSNPIKPLPKKDLIEDDFDEDDDDDFDHYDEDDE